MYPDRTAPVLQCTIPVGHCIVVRACPWLWPLHSDLHVCALGGPAGAPCLTSESRAHFARRAARCRALPSSPHLHALLAAIEARACAVQKPWPSSPHLHALLAALPPSHADAAYPPNTLRQPRPVSCARSIPPRCQDRAARPGQASVAARDACIPLILGTEPRGLAKLGQRLPAAPRPAQRRGGTCAHFRAARLGPDGRYGAMYEWWTSKPAHDGDTGVQTRPRASRCIRPLVDCTISGRHPLPHRSPRRCGRPQATPCRAARTFPDRRDPAARPARCRLPPPWPALPAPGRCYAPRAPGAAGVEPHCLERGEHLFAVAGHEPTPAAPLAPVDVHRSLPAASPHAARPLPRSMCNSSQPHPSHAPALPGSSRAASEATVTGRRSAPAAAPCSTGSSAAAAGLVLARLLPAPHLPPHHALASPAGPRRDSSPLTCSRPCGMSQTCITGRPSTGLVPAQAACRASAWPPVARGGFATRARARAPRSRRNLNGYIAPKSGAGRWSA